MSDGAHAPGTPRVVKLGGREIQPGPTLERAAAWIARQVKEGERVLVVHGGGEEVSALAARLGMATERVEGQRVTTPEVLELVEGVLAGPINLRVVQALQREGLRTLGVSGVSGPTVVAKVAGEGRWGLVGEPIRAQGPILRYWMGVGWVPVFAPLAAGPEGQVLNVNADLFAAGLAAALGGELVLVTDVPGVRDARGAFLPRLTGTEALELIRGGVARDGMIPKLQACVRALDGGAIRARLGVLPEDPQAPLEGTDVVLENVTWGSLPLPAPSAPLPGGA